VVNGDITTKSVIVMEGAKINGGVKMTEAAAAQLQSREGTPRSQLAVNQ
jgi:cytoskeletal protein CcmA (bactofilin family)